MTKVIEEIAAERHRQIFDEDWSYEHDNAHIAGQLADAAACYAWNAGGGMYFRSGPSDNWPWDRRWWKPTNPRRDLIKAAALIVAEIERLDRTSGADK